MQPLLKAVPAIAMVAIAGAGLAACGSGDPSGTESKGSESPSSNQTPSAPSSAPVADWKVAELEGAQFKAPADWEVKMKGATYVLSSPKQDDGASVGSGIFDAGPTLAMNTDELATETRGNVIGKYTKVERLSDEKFGQTTFFHIRGTGEVESYDLYGTLVGDTQVTVAWYFNTKLATADQIATWINQVMPTFKFEG